MKWQSEQVMEYYNLINKLVNNAIREKYSNLRYFEIGKESFNELFNPERDTYELPQLDIIMCVDFTKYPTDSDIGVWAMKYIRNAISMITQDSINFGNHKEIYVRDFLLNKTRYCKGIIPYTVD